MRILALGDVVGSAAIRHLEQHLWKIRDREHVDAVIANGENATEIRGLCAKDAMALLDAGADVITLGNHAFGMRDLYPILENSDRVIRPANYPPQAPGAGYTVQNVDGWKMLCINVSGRMYLDPLASPFDTVDRILDREKGNYDFSVLDIHAEATSEKLALAHYFDGRIGAIYGTHTHVPTADERILKKGTGYLTDVGMCGPVDSILGTAVEPVIEKFRIQTPVRFEVAGGTVEANGVLFDLDPQRNCTTSIRRITF